MNRNLIGVVGIAALVACRTAGSAPVRTASVSGDLRTAIALYQEGKYVEAEAALQGEASSEAKAYLAASLARQKKYAEAEAPAKEALKANPTHAIATAALGESLVGQKKYDEAVDRMSEVIQAKAEVAYAYFWRGQAYYARKQPDRMVGDFEAFLKLAPKAPEAPTVQQLLSSLK